MMAEGISLLGGARLRVDGFGIWPSWLWRSTTPNAFGIIVLWIIVLTLIVFLMDC